MTGYNLNSNFDNVAKKVSLGNGGKPGYYKITCIVNNNGRICSLIAMNNYSNFAGTGYTTPQLYILTGINTITELKSLKLTNLCDGNAVISESAYIENSYASFYFKIRADEWSNIAIIPLLESGTYSIEFISD